MSGPRSGSAPCGRAVAVALDIGTTTVAASCVEVSTGRVVSTATASNPQARWGADLISRVNAVVQAPELLGGMHSAITGACNGLIEELVPDGRVVAVAAAGNSVMEHIFLNVSPECFARVPYRPSFTGARTMRAGDAGLSCAPDAPLYVFPLIGGFVGGDTVAVALALGLGGGDAPALAVDIGTNSELILSAGGQMYAASAAAGPAFEAGELSCGMSAEKGAVAGVKIDADSVTLDVIGGGAPRGICGSGLISAVSGMLDTGVLDRTGRIRSPGEVTTNIAGRIKEGPDGNSFVLYRGAGVLISLTQADIRALQTAKAAIKAGLTILLKKAGLDRGGIAAVYMAGAFGSNLDKDALASIGVLDERWLPVTTLVGDAALDGVVSAVTSDERRREAESIASRVHYVSLSGSAHFEEEFIKSLDF